MFLILLGAAFVFALLFVPINAWPWYWGALTLAALAQLGVI